jgi:hypothetical protein
MQFRPWPNTANSNRKKSEAETRARASIKADDPLSAEIRGDRPRRADDQAAAERAQAQAEASGASQNLNYAILRRLGSGDPLSRCSFSRLGKPGDSDPTTSAKERSLA